MSLLLKGPTEEDKDEDEEEEDEEDLLDGDQKAKFEQKRHKKLTHEEDYYEILGLGHLRWRATEDQIKKAL